MKLHTVYRTDKGQRRCNEDALLLKSARIHDMPVVLAVICDGMGGLERGEIASAMFVREMNRWFMEEFTTMLKQYHGQTQQQPEALKIRWTAMVQEMNLRISGYGRLHGCELGTTVVAALLWGQQYLVMHVGDSRCYGYGLLQTSQPRADKKVWEDRASEQSSGSDIRLLTHDHTIVQMRVDCHELSVSEALHDPAANVLWQCIGASKEVIPDFETGHLNTGIFRKASLLICSDGFWRKQNGRSLRSLLRPRLFTSVQDLEGVMQKCFQMALKKGEKDNLSVILIVAE